MFDKHARVSEGETPSSRSGVASTRVVCEEAVAAGEKPTGEAKALEKLKFEVPDNE